MTSAASLPSQVVKRAKYKPSVKAPGIDGILKMTKERFTFRPNDPSKSPTLNVHFRLITGHKFSKPGSAKALLNLTKDQGCYIFEFENLRDRELCRDFVVYIADLWKMAPQSKKIDRISSLPQDITGDILTRMPIRDAIRTSILSRNWRSSWKSMTRLAFDDTMVTVPSNCQQLKKNKLALAILNVLLTHTGSILEILIDVSELDVDSEFDPIICFLSRLNQLQCLNIWGSDKRCYKLPYSFFSLQGLEVIAIYGCLFKPPIIFDGFSKLSLVRFSNVDVTSETLQVFLSKCPLITDLQLLCQGSRDFATAFATRNKFTFVELLQCVPLIENLEIKGSYMKHLSAGGMPHKLPTSLVRLKCLTLEMCYDEEHEVSSALCLIRSSPNLEKIVLRGCDDSYATQISENFPDIQVYSGLALDHLEFFCMQYFTYVDREVDFLKLILAKSPMLKKAQIELYESVSLEEENELLKDLLQLPLPRASPTAKLIFIRPEGFGLWRF